jgi:hypothetical protein
VRGENGVGSREPGVWSLESGDWSQNHGGRETRRGTEKKFKRKNSPPGVYSFELCEVARGTPGDSLEPQNIEQGILNDEERNHRDTATRRFTEDLGMTKITTITLHS